MTHKSPAPTDYVKVQSFIAVLHEYPKRTSMRTGSHIFSGRCISYDERLHLAFSLRDRNKNTLPSHAAKLQRFIIGDDAECQDDSLATCMANAVTIEVDTARSYLHVTSSVVGLPPIFIYQDPKKIIVSSDVHLLHWVHNVNLHFSLSSIIEMSRIGHPTNGKTLFKEVEMLPTGSSFTWSRGHIVTKRLWSYTDYVRPSGPSTDLHRLICSFKRALASIDISRSFLSLTGGLDTRTILALLVANETYLPAYTITGHRPSLDAKISSHLCKEYGIRHELIVLDDTFLKDLPNYVMEASRLSGGLCSLDEAHEIYFYSVINKALKSRLSGNLGNQLGRQGTERVSMRNASGAVLHKELTSRQKRHDASWHTGAMMKRGGAATLGFLIENELRAASLANYCIGNNYAVQQTPYATRSFIEEVLGYCHDTDRESMRFLRLRDLRHRFIGHRAEKSFQVQIIRETGGHVSAYPINWGWTVNGRFSLSGRIGGGLAFLDAALTRYVPSLMGKHGPTAFFFTGMHNYKHTEYWLHHHLRDFVLDTLSSSAAVNSGLFDCLYLGNVLKEYYLCGQDHSKVIQFALDLALAQKIFHAGL